MGTETALEYRDERFNVKTEDDIRRNAAAERKRRQMQFETDRDANLQPNVMPMLDDSLISFQVEYLFQYDDEDGNPYTAWCDGVVESIANKKQGWL